MSAILIRNLPDDVHDALRKQARAAGRSVESLARETLIKLARNEAKTGIDFARIERTKAELGIEGEWPEWTEEMDDPAFSRRVLGLTD